MLLKPAVLKGSLATGLGVGAGPGVPGDPVLSVNNCFFCKTSSTQKIRLFFINSAKHYTIAKQKEQSGNEERIEPSMEEVLAVPLPASPPTEPGN